MLRHSTKKRLPSQKFWDWFELNNHRFINLANTNNEDLLDEITDELHKFNPRVSFLLGGQKNETNELIITADGNKQFFESVLELVRSYPKIDGWKVTAFKQPLGFDFGIQYEDLEIDPDAIWFREVCDGPNFSLGINIACDDYNEANTETIRNAIHFYLDVGLGERSNSSDILLKNIESLPEDPDILGYHSIEELPQFIELYKSQFN